MTTQQLERAFEEAKTQQMDLLVGIKRRMFAEDRGMTAGETEQMQAALARTKTTQEQLARARSGDAMTAEIDRLTTGMSGGHDIRGNSIGAQFLRSSAMQWFRDNKRSLPANWSSPSVEIQATTLTEGAASGGKLIVPDYRPGIVPLPTRLPTVRDLLSEGTTTSNLSVYMKETTFTNAAAAVAEGAAKPESTLVFDQVSDKVEKLATWIPVTEEMLDDEPQIRSYIDERLMTGVRLVEDDQLLNGDGVSPNLLGLLNRPGLAADIPRGTMTNADCVAAQLAAIQTSTNLVPTGIIVHPTNWQTISLAKDTTGQYLGGGPFATPQVPTLWGKPVAVTTAIAAGKALVVTRSAAMVLERTGLILKMSNSHASFFIENKVAIVCEERIAMDVFRAAAFGTCSGLN